MRHFQHIRSPLENLTIFHFGACQLKAVRSQLESNFQVFGPNSIINHAQSAAHLHQFPLKAAGNLHLVFPVRSLPVLNRSVYNWHEEAEGRGFAAELIGAKCNVL